MGLNNCCIILKYLLVLINLLFWIIGLLTVVGAIWMLTDRTFLFSLTQDTTNYQIALYIFLIVGALMVIVAFFGCCGSFKESQCLLVSFFCCLLVVMVAGISAGGWAYYNKDKLNDMVRSSVLDTIQQEYKQHGYHARSDALDTFQRKLKCCGADGTRDWMLSKYNHAERPANINLSNISKTTTFLVPESCCKENIDKAVCDNSRKLIFGTEVDKNIQKDGCIDKLLVVIREHWTILLIVTIVVILLELLGLIFSLVLCCAIKNNDNYKA